MHLPGDRKHSVLIAYIQCFFQYSVIFPHLAVSKDFQV